MSHKNQITALSGDRKQNHEARSPPDGGGGGVAVSPTTLGTPTNRGGRCVEHKFSRYKGESEAACSDKLLEPAGKRPESAKTISTLTVPKEVEGNKVIRVPA